MERAFRSSDAYIKYLGKEVPEETWNKNEVYRVIKSKLKEVHLIGISHNDVRLANIHVSVSGKISLIDFGLSDSSNNDSSNNEEHKKNDFETLDYILRTRGSSENNCQESQEMFHDEADNYVNYESDRTCSYEEDPDRINTKTYISTTKEDIMTKKEHR